MLLACLAACGAVGQGVDETGSEGTVENAVSGSVGPLQVEDAYAQLDQGALEVHFLVDNTGDAPDRLLSVRPAGRWTGVYRSRLPARLGPGQLVDLDRGAGALTVVGLDPSPAAGSELAVTFRFEQAGELVLPLPVVASAP